MDRLVTTVVERETTSANKKILQKCQCGSKACNKLANISLFCFALQCLRSASRMVPTCPTPEVCLPVLSSAPNKRCNCRLNLQLRVLLSKITVPFELSKLIKFINGVICNDCNGLQISTKRIQQVSWFDVE